MAAGVLPASGCFAVPACVDGVSLSVFLSVFPSLSGCFGVTVSIGDLSILLLLRKAVPYSSS